MNIPKDPRSYDNQVAISNHQLNFGVPVFLCLLVSNLISKWRGKVNQVLLHIND